MTNRYDDSQIQVLEGLEAVRKRPGMYIGNTNEQGLHHLVWEIVDNAVDEALAGFCDEITIKLHKDNSITVIDNGRGIPTGINVKTGKSTIETIFTVLHAGGKFDGSGYKVSGGLHGVGSSVVNALSDFLIVEVQRDGNKFKQEFAKGDAVGALQNLGTSDETGTLVTFKPSADIFAETTIIKLQIIKSRVQQLAYLNKGLKITLIDDRIDFMEEFYCENGIVDFVEARNENNQKIIENPIYFESEHDDVAIELAIVYYDGDREKSDDIISFANNIHTTEGGAHEVGFRAALTKVINKYAIANALIKKDSDKLQGEDARVGLSAIISVKVMEPLFEGQTKHKLANVEVRTAVDRLFQESFGRYLEENPAEAKVIVEKGILARTIRLRMAQQAKLVREELKEEKGAISPLVGKLADCSSKNPFEREIYIVEGDSAGGSAKMGRDRATQAILPLRGKVINVEKAQESKILANNEIRTMITAFGTGYGENFDIEKLKYHTVVIMTDADVDGAHIRTLLLTFFHKYMSPLIENGNLYIACPPLYKIESGKSKFYVHSNEERDEHLEMLGPDAKFTVQRYKGLGEMNPEELKDTTMDPEGRTLLQVSLEDAQAASDIFDALMGDEVEPRRDFINKNAQYVKNLDI